MPPFSYPFSFQEGNSFVVKGTVDLESPEPFHYNSWGNGFYRSGSISIDDEHKLELALYHSEATAAFMYLRTSKIDTNQLDIIGLNPEEIGSHNTLQLPGQLCLGSDRSKLISKAMQDIFCTPIIKTSLESVKQQNVAIFPIAREGLKYHVSEAIYENFGYYCDEVVLDAHHVFDSSVPVYNRKVEMTLFKDKDLDKSQRERITIAYLADSIASGLVMKEVIARVKERFENLQSIEVISPLATIRGLSRIARSESLEGIKVRVHVFETLLNALPPDYYYSAHYNIPELHIQPELEQEYRNWWGQDEQGAFIADTACAGYGWSEVFYSPRKQIQMMNGQLQERHQLSIADIVRRSIH